MSQLSHLQLLGRKHCCLCDDAELAVRHVESLGLCTWAHVDVDADPVLKKQYGMDVPVLLLNGEACMQHQVEVPELVEILRKAAPKQA